MIAKLGIVEEEADECGYWLELFLDSGCQEADEARALYSEAAEILAMTVASKRTLKASQIRESGGVEYVP